VCPFSYLRIEGKTKGGVGKGRRGEGKKKLGEEKWGESGEDIILGAGRATKKEKDWEGVTLKIKNSEEKIQGGLETAN